MAKYSARRERRFRHAPPLTAKEQREERWRNYVFRHLRFLGHVKHNRESGMDSWRAGMVKHYRKVIAEALDHPPPGLEPEAEDFRRKLKRL